MLTDRERVTSDIQYECNAHRICVQNSVKNTMCWMTENVMYAIFEFHMSKAGNVWWYIGTAAWNGQWSYTKSATKVNARTLWKTIHNGKIIQKLYATPVEMSTLSFPINSSRLFIKFGLCAPSEEDNSVFIDRAGKLMRTIYRNWTANFELELCLFRLNSCSTDSNELNVEFIVDKKKQRTVNRVKSRKCLCPTATICMHTFRGKSSIERII